MKKIILILSLCFSIINVFAQTEENATVYFIRNGTYGGLIHFDVYNDSLWIGQLRSNSFIKYECKPGKKIFWSVSENKAFVEADLKPGKTYVVNVSVKMGALFARVGFEHFKHNKAFNRMLEKIFRKDKKSIVDKENPSFAPAMQYENVMSRYKNLKSKKKPIPQIDDSDIFDLSEYDK